MEGERGRRKEGGRERKRAQKRKKDKKTEKAGQSKERMVSLSLANQLWILRHCFKMNGQQKE